MIIIMCIIIIVLLPLLVQRLVVLHKGPTTCHPRRREGEFVFDSFCYFLVISFISTFCFRRGEGGI